MMTLGSYRLGRSWRHHGDNLLYAVEEVEAVLALLDS
jgi:hypothetical protein